MSAVRPASARRSLIGHISGIPVQEGRVAAYSSIAPGMYGVATWPYVVQCDSVSERTFQIVLASRWKGFGLANAGSFLMSAVGSSALGHKGDLARPALRMWNEISHPE